MFDELPTLLGDDWSTLVQVFPEKSTHDFAALLACVDAEGEGEERPPLPPPVGVAKFPPFPQADEARLLFTLLP